MTYEVIILGHLHMPLYFIGTFTEYSTLRYVSVRHHRSDGIKTGIGIEEKMPLDFIFNYYFFLLISATKISNSEE